MARQATARPDFVPHLPDLIVSMAECWRTIGDAQTEVDPFGANYAALGEARDAIGAAVDRLTGQNGFLALARPESGCASRQTVHGGREGRAVRLINTRSPPGGMKREDGATQGS